MPGHVQKEEKKVKRRGDGTRQLKTAHSWQRNLNTKTLQGAKKKIVQGIFKGFGSFLVQGTVPSHSAPHDIILIQTTRLYLLTELGTGKCNAKSGKPPCPGSTHFFTAERERIFLLLYSAFQIFC